MTHKFVSNFEIVINTKLTSSWSKKINQEAMWIQMEFNLL